MDADGEGGELAYTQNDPREDTTQDDEDGEAYAWNDSEDTSKNLLSLNEQDFPLVCTFNYFLKLLENTIKSVPVSYHVRYSNILLITTTRVKNRGELIDFSDFKTKYWRRFPAHLRKGIVEDLAFMEIMGVIKGSMSFVSNPEPLSRDDYINKRWRAAPSFATDNERDAVYSLYENYERLKMSRSEIDNIDRVIHAAKELNKNPDLQRRVEKFLDEVYVDGEYRERGNYPT